MYLDIRRQNNLYENEKGYFAFPRTCLTFDHDSSSDEWLKSGAYKMEA
eukprot:SAG11_NODE_26594_length_343_cov_0.770492_2_plen_47_part_01